MAQSNTETKDAPASELKRIVSGNLKGKVLMHGQVMVNELMLDQGIYETNNPTVHWRSNLTIEEFIEEMKFFDETFNKDKSSDYYKNLRKCKFVDVELKINQ